MRLLRQVFRTRIGTLEVSRRESHHEAQNTILTLKGSANPMTLKAVERILVRTVLTRGIGLKNGKHMRMRLDLQRVMVPSSGIFHIRIPYLMNSRAERQQGNNHTDHRITWSGFHARGQLDSNPSSLAIASRM